MADTLHAVRLLPDTVRMPMQCTALLVALHTPNNTVATLQTTLYMGSCQTFHMGSQPAAAATKAHAACSGAPSMVATDTSATAGITTHLNHQNRAQVAPAARWDFCGGATDACHSSNPCHCRWHHGYS